MMVRAPQRAYPSLIALLDSHRGRRRQSSTFAPVGPRGRPRGTAGCRSARVERAAEPCHGSHHGLRSALGEARCCQRYSAGAGATRPLRPFASSSASPRVCWELANGDCDCTRVRRRLALSGRATANGEACVGGESEARRQRTRRLSDSTRTSTRTLGERRRKPAARHWQAAGSCPHPPAHPNGVERLISLQISSAGGCCRPRA